MKKVIGLLLTICITLSAPMVSFGATEYEIDFDKIEKIVLYHSSFKAESDKVISKIYSEYIDSSLRTSSLYALYKHDETTANYDAYVSSSNNTWSLEYQVKTTKLNEEKKINNLVLAADKAYVAYFDSLKAKEKVIKNLETKEKEFKILELKYNKGLISANTLEEARDTIENSDELIKEADDTIEAKIVALREALGIKTEDTINILQMTALDKGYKEAKSTVYTEDLAQLLKNSIEIKTAQIDADRSYIIDGKYSQAYKQTEKTLNDTKKNTEKAFNKQYKLLMTNVKNIEKLNKKVSKTWKAYSNGKEKYDRDMISKKSLEELKQAYYLVRDERNTAKVEMITEKMAYDLVKKGY